MVKGNPEGRKFKQQTPLSLQARNSICDCMCSVAQSSDSLRPHGLQPARLPLSMGLSSPEYWRGLLFPSPGDPPDLGIEPVSLAPPTLQAGSLLPVPPGKHNCYYYCHCHCHHSTGSLPKPRGSRGARPALAMVPRFSSQEESSGLNVPLLGTESCPRQKAQK